MTQSLTAAINDEFERLNKLALSLGRLLQEAREVLDNNRQSDDFFSDNYDVIEMIDKIDAFIEEVREEASK